jgi:hypothetical protein
LDHYFDYRVGWKYTESIDEFLLVCLQFNFLTISLPIVEWARVSITSINWLCNTFENDKAFHSTLKDVATFDYVHNYHRYFVNIVAYNREIFYYFYILPGSPMVESKWLELNLFPLVVENDCPIHYWLLPISSTSSIFLNK